jgi:hypothetical protein
LAVKQVDMKGAHGFDFIFSFSFAGSIIMLMATETHEGRANPVIMALSSGQSLIMTILVTTASGRMVFFR